MYVHDYATRLYTHAVYSKSTQSTACTVVFLYYFTPWVVCVGGRGEGVWEGGGGEGV